MAEAAGDATPDGVQEFLSRVRWNADAARDDLQGDVVEHLADPAAVLVPVLNETGFLKKGTKSAGVQRQYTGTAGRIENAQMGVFLGYAGRLRRRPVTTWIEDLAADAWQRLSAGDGAKGPRLHDWAHLPFNGAAKGFACALLVRRSIARPDQVAFYLTHAPQGTSLANLVRVAGTRWSIESLFEQAKGEVGPDHYEVRSWVGWHRHVTLSMFAVAYLALAYLALAYLALAYLAVVRRSAEQGATGGCGPGKPYPGPPAAHGSRGQAAHRGAGAKPAAPAQPRLALVNLATTPPATRQARPLAHADTKTLW